MGTSMCVREGVLLVARGSRTKKRVHSSDDFLRILALLDARCLFSAVLVALLAGTDGMVSWRHVYRPSRPWAAARSPHEAAGRAPVDHFARAAVPGGVAQDALSATLGDLW